MKRIDDLANDPGGTVLDNAIAAPLTVLIISEDAPWSRPLRRSLVRRGARPVLAHGMAEASRLVIGTRPDVLVVGDPFSGSTASSAMALALLQTPPSAVMALEPGDHLDPSGLGMGLLYSGHRSASPGIVLDVLERAFPGRLLSAAPRPDVAPLVLCVDDDPGYLHALSRLIRQHGYRVAEFGEGVAALEAIPGLRPAVALVDLSMPGMDGCVLTRTICSRFGDRVPVVVLTGRESSADLLAGYRDGASYYLTKSCPPVRVLRIIDYLAGTLEPMEREMLELRL